MNTTTIGSTNSNTKETGAEALSETTNPEELNRIVDESRQHVDMLNALTYRDQGRTAGEIPDTAEYLLNAMQTLGELVENAKVRRAVYRNARIAQAESLKKLAAIAKDLEAKGAKSNINELIQDANFQHEQSIAWEATEREVFETAKGAWNDFALRYLRFYPTASGLEPSKMTRN